jgi:hypothetical protein
MELAESEASRNRSSRIPLHTEYGGLQSCTWPNKTLTRKNQYNNVFYICLCELIKMDTGRLNMDADLKRDYSAIFKHCFYFLG